MLKVQKSHAYGEKRVLTLLPISVVFNLHDVEVDETSAMLCLYQQAIFKTAFSLLSFCTHVSA
jgi:hypothetical protein